jgi:hypothetical protein
MVEMTMFDSGIYGSSVFITSMLIGVMLFIFFSIARHHYDRARFIKKLMNGDFDLPGDAGKENTEWKDSKIAMMLQVDRQKNLRLSVLSTLFVVAIIGLAFYYVSSVVNKYAYPVIISTYVSLTCCYGIYSALTSHFKSKKENENIKGNVSPELYYSFFKRLNSTESRTLKFMIACNSVGLLAFGLLLYRIYINS